MNEVLEKVDEMPVTLVVIVAYVTMSYVTGAVDPDPELLDRYGWLTSMTVAEGEWWRLLTSSFLHGGPLHLLMNTGALVVFGPAMEKTLGSARFALLYLVAELGSSLAVCIVYDPRQPVVGGSGALFGLLGAVVAWQMQSGRNALSFLDYEGPRRMIGLVALYTIGGMFLPFISNTSHVGGLITGFAVTFLFLTPARQHSERLQLWRGAFVTLLLGLTLYAVRPVTRWDWLWNRSNAAASLATQDELRRLALMSYYGKSDVSAFERRQFEQLELRPDREGR